MKQMTKMVEGGKCGIIDSGEVIYRLSYMYVPMCRHMSGCEYTYVGTYGCIDISRVVS